MPFDSSKAESAWKKAKPLMLPPTGIGKLLHALPPKPESKDLVKFEAAMKTLTTKLDEPKLKAAKKAHECVKTIRDDIKKYLDDIKSDRPVTIALLKRMHVFGAAYLENIGKAADLGTAVAAPFMSAPDSQALKYLGFTPEHLTPEILAMINGGALIMNNARLKMIAIVKAGKEAKNPEADTRRGLTAAAIPEFKTGMKKLEEAWTKIAGLK